MSIDVVAKEEDGREFLAIRSVDAAVCIRCSINLPVAGKESFPTITVSGIFAFARDDLLRLGGNLPFASI